LDEVPGVSAIYFDNNLILFLKTDLAVIGGSISVKLSQLLTFMILFKN